MIGVAVIAGAATFACAGLQGDRTAEGVFLASAEVQAGKDARVSIR
jgi:hypothetical protein